MLRRISIQFSMMLLVVLLFCHVGTYATVAYIPQELKECFLRAYEVAEKGDNFRNLEELSVMMRENRTLASDDMVREAIKEASDILENYKNSSRERYYEVTNYFQEYLDSLDDSSVLLAMHGNTAQLTAWPVSLFSRSINNSSVIRDMMCLSSELAFAQNLPLCGNVDLDSSLKTDILPHTRSRLHKRDIDFDDDMMVGCTTNLPAIMFGTGVASPVINAWRMSPSDLLQYPIGMQFSIPGYLHPKKTIMLELHFLVKQHAAPNGTVRIRVNGMYMNVDDDGVITNPDTIVAYTVDSKDCLVTEQLGTSNSLRHICIKIRLEKALFKTCNAASLSLTRIEPTTGVEYADDLYLAAAVLRYAVQ